jgi:hypothetical protein
VKARQTSRVSNVMIAVKAVRDLSPSVTNLVVVLRLKRVSIQSVVALKVRLSHGVMVIMILNRNVKANAAQ